MSDMSSTPDLSVSIALSEAALAKSLAAIDAKIVKFINGMEKKTKFKLGTDDAEASAKAMAAELDRLQTKFNPVYAQSKKYEAALRELNLAQSSGVINAKQHAVALATLNAEMIATSNASQVAVRGGRGFTNFAQQAGYQVGDFAVQVGGGTSAMQAFGQQAPQLLGGLAVFGGAMGAVGAIAGTAVAIAVPLARAFFDMGEEAKPLSERITDLEAATSAYTAAAEAAAVPIEDLRVKYGGMADEVKRALDLQRDFAGVAAASAMTVARSDIGSSAGLGKQQGAYGIAVELGTSIGKAEGVQSALDAINSSTDLSTATAGVEALNAALTIVAGTSEEAVKRFGGEDGLLTAANAYLTQMREQFGAGMSEAEKTALRLSDEYDTRTRALIRLTTDRASAEEMVAQARADGDQAAVASATRILSALDDQIAKTVDAKSRVADMSEELDRATKIAGSAALNPEFEAEAKAAANELKRAVDQGTALSDVDLGGLEARVKSLTDRAKEMADEFVRAGGGISAAAAAGYAEYGATRRASDAGSLAGGMGASKALIRDKESYSQSAYWDVNHYRAGYGSDTGTRADGTVYTVGKETQVSLDDAERDLERRIATYFDAITQQIGPTAFAALSSDQKASLASLLHNYGAGEFKDGGDLGGVLSAVKSGNSQATADQIARRGGDNGGVNRERRLSEAQAFGGASTGVTASMTAEQKALEAQVKSREDLAAAQLKFSDQITSSLADAEFEATLIGKSAEAQAALRSEYLLTAQAKSEGIDLNAKMAGSELTYAEAIKAKAAADGQAAAAADVRKEAEARAVAQMQVAVQAQQELKNGLLDSILAGGSFADTLSNIAMMFAKAQLQAALFGNIVSSSTGGQSSSGGLLSGLFNSLMSFDGGGYTGTGARSGGVDGKGGMLSIVHPNETVIDHAKGQIAVPSTFSAPSIAASAAKASRTSVDVGVSVSDDGQLQAYVTNVATKQAQSAATGAVRYNRASLLASKKFARS